MVYTDRSKLSRFELKKDRDYLAFDEIAKLLQEQPTNIIYCELGEILVGVVSMGDVARVGRLKREVKINRHFTSVKSGEFMKIRQIFRDNSKINGLPVLDENGRLLGEYSRWDDVMVLEYLIPFKNDLYISKFWNQNSYVALVKPSSIFEKKNKYFEDWKAQLEQGGYCKVKVIDRMDVPEYSNRVDKILFVDEDECRGTVTLLRNVLNKEFDDKIIRTYRKIYQEINDNALIEMENKVLRVLQEAGVHVLAVRCSNNGSEYSKKLRAEALEKYIRANVDKITGITLPDPEKKDFFGKLYTKEYADSIFGYRWDEEITDGICILKDVSGKYFNVKNGERLTIGQPELYERTIYFFGPCVIIGAFTEDKHTIESLLQAKLNEQKRDIRVVNLGGWSLPVGELNKVIATEFQQGDIIVIYHSNREISGVRNINLEDSLERNNASVKWIADIPQHCNYKVNEIYTEAIYEELKPLFDISTNFDRRSIRLDKGFMTNLYLQRFFSHFDPKSYSAIGAIVMNCNPFTKGHRYLIEEALKIVDYLIIFVVEENKSTFDFSERFAFVSGGVADLHNVMVVPSGRFILSQITFPEYFVKVVDEDLIKNVEYDITLFAEQIAPELNITYRFVGEEPEDAVTKEYNLAMKRILPARGIQLVEIPRVESGKGVISASRVRKCMENNDFKTIGSLVPESTKRILFWTND